MTPLGTAVLWLAAGIALAVLGPAPAWSGPVLLPVAVVGAAVALLLATGRPGFTRRPLPLFLLAGLVLGAGTRTAAARSCQTVLPADRPVRIEAVVTTAPSERSTRLELEPLAIALDAGEISCAGSLPARWQPGGGAAMPAHGARVTVHGRWWSPAGAGGALRRPGTLLVDVLRISAREAGAEAPGLGVPGPPGPGPGPPGPTAVRASLLHRIDALYPRHAPLVASLLLARRDGLDPEIREQYARAGLSHLLAISGLHVGLVAGMLVLVLGAMRAPRGLGSAVAAGGTAGYVAFLGAPHSAVRAALQIVLALAARALQRPTRTGSIVAAAALCLLAAEPGALFQAGFQLSFAGVIGILWLRPPLIRMLAPVLRLRIGKRRPGEWLRDALATSIAATLATAPIVAWHFGRVAPIGILANIVAIPLLGFAVPALALSLSVSALSPGTGAFVAGGAAALLDALNAVAANAAAVPGGTVAVAPASVVVLGSAAAAGYALSRRAGRVRASVRTAIWAGAGGAVLLLSPLRIPVDRLEIHMIDVGQGDAIAIRSPAGRWILVDAGLATDRYDAGAARVVPYLGRRGVTRLEGLIVTHADADHMGGAGAVITALRPRWIGDPGHAAGKPDYLRLLRSAEASGTRWIGLRQGVTIDLDGASLEVLYPDAAVASDPPEDANDASVVLRIEYGEFSALLTGDAPSEVEEALARLYGARLEAEVLKVGHHGSNTSTSPDLLAAAGPRHALISAGRANRYGHPHHDVLARLERAGVRIHRTDRDGSIIVRGWPAGRIEIRTGRGADP